MAALLFSRRSRHALLGGTMFWSRALSRTDCSAGTRGIGDMRQLGSLLRSDAVPDRTATRRDRCHCRRQPACGRRLSCFELAQAAIGPSIDCHNTPRLSATFLLVRPEVGHLQSSFSRDGNFRSASSQTSGVKRSSPILTGMDSRKSCSSILRTVLPRPSRRGLPTRAGAISPCRQRELFWRPRRTPRRSLRNDPAGAEGDHCEWPAPVHQYGLRAGAVKVTTCNRHSAR